MKKLFTFLIAFGLLAANSYSQVTNDVCADAISIDCGDVQTGSTATATTTGNPGTCSTSMTAPSVWFTFVGTGDDVTLSLNGSDYDTKLFLFSGDCGNLVCVDGDDDGGDGLQSYIYSPTDAGVTYYVIVSGFSSNTGNYNLEYNCVTCPLISGLSVEVSATSATVDWANSNVDADYVLEYGEAGFTPGTGTTLTGVAGTDGPPVIIPDLTSLTTYDVYVHEECTAVDLTNELSTSFMTTVDGPGTSCVDPIILNNNLPYVSNDASFCGYGNNIGISNCFPFTTSNEEIIFAYSPETDGEVLAISLDNLSGNYAFVSVLDGCPDDVDASCIASIQSPFGESSVLLDGIDVLSGEIYYIMISTYSWNPCLTFDLSIGLVTCPTPSALSAVSNSDGSAELNWTSNSDATEFEVEWGIAGFTLGTGTVVGGTYGVDGPPVSIDGLTSENNYEFYITDFCGFGSTSLPGGPFEFSGPPPANDQCADAISIECGDFLTGNTSAATTIGNPTEFCGTGMTAPSVWYSFVGTGDDVTLSTDGSDYDTKLFLFSGSCGSLVCIDGDDDGGSGLQSYIYSTTEVGVTYYVIVSGYSSSTGIYNLAYNCVTCPLINGLVISATDVTGNINWTTTNDGADYYIEYGPAGFTPGTGTIVSGVVGTDGPPVDVTGLTAGTTYDVYVHEECTSVDFSNELSGTFTTNLLPPPANDLCSDAILLNCGDTDSGSTVNATQIGNPAGPLCGFMTLNSNAVWYQIVGNGQLATVNTCGSDFDTELFVFTGSCDELICYVGADGNNGGCTSGTAWGPSLVEFLAEEGVTYYVAVAGWSSFYSGNYEVSYECNACGDPNSLSVGYDDVSATISWQTYLPGANYTMVYGLDGTDLWNDGTTLSASNSELPVIIEGLTANTTYDFCFFEYCEAEMANTDTICGSFTTNLLPPPANDLCGNAAAIACGDVVSGNTDYASAIGNPTGTCGTSSSTAGAVWYSFTGTGDDVSLSLNGSDYDTKIFLYSGDCGNLVCVDGDDDGGNGLQSYLYSPTVAGETYYVLVAGFGSNTGDYTLEFLCFECNISDLIVTQIGTSATIFWTGNDTANYVIEYGPVGFTPGQGTIITGNTGSPVQIFDLLDNTAYDVYVYETCSNGATSQTLFATFDVVDGISELSFGSTVSVYPNPVSDILTIEINAEITAGSVISIISMQGQVIYQETVKDNVSEYRTEIDVDNFARGMYLLKLEDENASIQQRIIVQ